MALSLKVEHVYPATGGSALWRGTSLCDASEFELYLRGPVRKRVEDTAEEERLKTDLKALEFTGMNPAFVEKLLSASPPPIDWEIGEALAECLLEDEFAVAWPWNENRDRKTPKASLPGADIVGFADDGDGAVFLFGEVKTSSDKGAPPGVMSGRSGLAHQIDDLATSIQIHLALIKWLGARCRDTEFQGRFESALARYVKSEGKDFQLVGVLLRDTPPHADDLRTRGVALAKKAPLPKTRLDAWYAPRSISDWVTLTMAST
jgi:hypothetical protein